MSFDIWYAVQQYDAMNDDYRHIVRFRHQHLAWEYINKRNIRYAKVVKEYH